MWLLLCIFTSWLHYISAQTILFFKKVNKKTELFLLILPYPSVPSSSFFFVKGSIITCCNGLFSCTFKGQQVGEPFMNFHIYISAHLLRLTVHVNQTKGHHHCRLNFILISFRDQSSTKLSSLCGVCLSQTRAIWWLVSLFSISNLVIASFNSYKLYSEFGHYYLSLHHIKV